MLFAKRNIKKDNIKRYLLLLNDFMQKRDKTLGWLFVTLFAHTQGIVNGTMTFYQIPERETIPLVAYLAKTHPDYFKSIDTDSLSPDHFSQLKVYMEEAVVRL